MRKSIFLVLVITLSLFLSVLNVNAGPNEFEGDDGSGGGGNPETLLIQEAKSKSEKCVKRNWLQACVDKEYYTQEVYHNGSNPVIEPLYINTLFSAFTAASKVEISKSVTEKWEIGFGIERKTSSGINVIIDGIKLFLEKSIKLVISGKYHEHEMRSSTLVYNRPEHIPSGHAWNIAFYSFNEKAKLYDVTYDDKSPYRNELKRTSLGDFYITRLAIEWGVSTEDAYKTNEWMNQTFDATILAVKNNSKD